MSVACMEAMEKVDNDGIGWARNLHFN